MKWLLYVLVVLVAIPVLVAAIGAMLPKAHVATRKIALNTGPQKVFALISGPSDWRGFKYERISESPLQWRETDKSGDTITYERVETAEPTRIVNRIADKSLPFGGTWTYEISPTPSGCELTITENGEVYNVIFRFVSRFIMGHTATIDKYLGEVEKQLRS